MTRARKAVCGQTIQVYCFVTFFLISGNATEQTSYLSVWFISWRPGRQDNNHIFRWHKTHMCFHVIVFHLFVFCRLRGAHSFVVNGPRSPGQLNPCILESRNWLGRFSNYYYWTLKWKWICAHSYSLTYAWWMQLCNTLVLVHWKDNIMVRCSFWLRFTKMCSPRRAGNIPNSPKDTNPQMFGFIDCTMISNMSTCKFDAKNTTDEFKHMPDLFWKAPGRKTSCRGPRPEIRV